MCNITWSVPLGLWCPGSALPLLKGWGRSGFVAAGRWQCEVWESPSASAGLRAVPAAPSTSCRLQAACARHREGSWGISPLLQPWRALLRPGTLMDATMLLASIPLRALLPCLPRAMSPRSPLAARRKTMRCELLLPCLAEGRCLLRPGVLLLRGALLGSLRAELFLSPRAELFLLQQVQQRHCQLLSSARGLHVAPGSFSPGVQTLSSLPSATSLLPSSSRLLHSG